MQPDVATPILELRGFAYTYLEGTPRASEAVRDVSFRIHRGERVGIVGATESGKSPSSTPLHTCCASGRDRSSTKARTWPLPATTGQTAA